MQAYYKLICLFIFSLSQLNAQELPLLTQYRDMQGIINPAAVSMDFVHYKFSSYLGGNYRQQWVNFDEAPSTQLLHYERLKPVGESRFVSGSYFQNDVLGKESTMGLIQRVAYMLSPDASESGLSVGFSAGMNQYRLRLSQTNPHDVNDIIYRQSDPKFWYPEVGVGLWGFQKIGYFKDIIYGGLSVPQVLGLSRQLGDLPFVSRRYQHYYLNAGYVHALNGEDRDVEVSSWVKFVPHVPINVDLNVRYKMANFLKLGVGYNTNSTIHSEITFIVSEAAGFDKGLFRIGYSFDWQFARANVPAYWGNSHEIHASWAFGE
jgi:type IX secretion system PorP/SprF family membrane protein